jgi:hypothetical protein
MLIMSAWTRRQFEQPVKKQSKRPGPPPVVIDHVRAESVSAMGGTNAQIASALGVSIGTLFNARKRDKGLDEAIGRGKDKADLQVVSALYKKAIGYDTLDKGGKTVWLAGDTTAMIFWLKNRRPLEWKDRKDMGIGNIPDADGKVNALLVKVVHVKGSDKGNGNGNGNGNGDAAK